MELTLLGTVAVAAFLVVGAFILLIVSFRRTIELRGALIQSLRRIEKLESAILAGQPIQVMVTGSAPADALAAPETLSAPRLLPPTVDEIVADAEARDRIDPPQLGVLSLGAGVAAFAALAAAQVGSLSGGAGLFVALLVGLLTLASAEWRRRADKQETPSSLMQAAPATLAALIGVAIMIASILFARYGLEALRSHDAVGAMGTLALMAAALSLWFGPWLILAALLCAAIAPGLSPIGADGAWGQYLFLAVFTGIVLVLSRRAGAPLWAWLSMAVALFWGGNAAFIGGAGFNLGVAGLYLAALAAQAMGYAWRAGIALPYPRLWAAAWREPMLLGAVAVLVAAITLAALLLRHGPDLSFGGPALVAFVLVANGAAALRPGLWPAAFIAAMVAAASLAFYPSAGDAAEQAPALLAVAGALGLIFTLGGVAGMTQSSDARPGAALASLAPILILASAYWRIGDFGGPQAWATAALALAVLNAGAHLHFRRNGSPAASPFAAGAALGLAITLIAIAPTPYQPLALAACLPLVALAERWRQDAGLRFAGGALCALLCALLFLPPLFGFAAPLWQSLALFLPSAAAAWIASLIYARGGREDAGASETALAVALFVAACCATLVARHAFNGGLLYAPYSVLAEAGSNTLTWLAFATLLAWRFGPNPRRTIYALELTALCAAAAHAFLISGVWINPWWGYAPAAVHGPPGLDHIALAFAAPGALLILYAWVRTRHRLGLRAAAAIGAAAALFFLNLILELRRLFHGAAMAAAPVTQAEAWTYSIATLGFAALLLALAAQRRGAVLRVASLGLALAALTKMAFSDLGALDGAARIIAFVAIALAAGGVIFVFRRFVLPPAPRQPKTMPETNLAPPSST
ncbi:MAG: DUF2339 domain-containing protein [Hyphomonadaceae bacterium]